MAKYILQKEAVECAQNEGAFDVALWLENMETVELSENITDVQPVKRCKMIPLEPDCRNYTDVFICTNCHNHIHLGFIRKEYSGSYCLECGAEVMDGDME